MPTLNWIGKDAVVKHHQQVPFHLLRDVPDLDQEATSAKKALTPGYPTV